MKRLLLISCCLLTSCASRQAAVETGHFSGSLDLRWLAPDRFLYIPNQSDPFQFVRANGEVITPGPMYTDGGSSPPIMRPNQHFSPWGYGPAFVLHDWLFFEASQRANVADEFDFEEASLILAEAMATMAEAGTMPDNRAVRRLFQRTGTSSFAKKAIWLRPWYGELPHPVDLANQPSAAFDGELKIIDESLSEAFRNTAAEMKENHLKRLRFGEQRPLTSE